MKFKVRFLIVCCFLMSSTAFAHEEARFSGRVRPYNPSGGSVSTSAGMVEYCIRDNEKNIENCSKPYDDSFDENAHARIELLTNSLSMDGMSMLNIPQSGFNVFSFISTNANRDQMCPMADKKIEKLEAELRRLKNTVSKGCNSGGGGGGGGHSHSGSTVR